MSRRRRRPLNRRRRALRIFLRLSPFVVAFLRDRRRWILFGRPRPASFEQHQSRADRLVSTLADLGATFIKLAQVFSARGDIIPEPYLSAIGQLQDRVPPDPPEGIARVIEEELGQPAAEVFEEFQVEPDAAASLAQVHRARVSGQTVAVKVQRPHVGEVIATDLDISFRVLLLLNILFRTHHVKALTAVVREFSARIREELDFRQEAEHMGLFHRYFSRDPRVRAPRVYPHYTRRRLLVMEWVQGDKIDELDARLASGEIDFTRLMETLQETYLRMMMVEGFMHADPHPGNIVVDRRGTIVLLDWGMAVRLSRSTRDQVLRIALAAGRNDLDGMIGGMYALGMIDPDVSRAEIRDAAAEILEILERARELGTRRVQEMVQEILNTFYTWPLILPQELVYFFRAAALLEGIGLRYDPNFNGLASVRPVIRRMRNELLIATGHEPAAVARNVLEDVAGLLHDVRHVLRRAEREELRVRIHPRDIFQTERFFLLQVRRILLSIFALTVSLITSITFIVLQNIWILLLGLAIAFFMFGLVFIVPTRLLENPLRHARGLRPDDARGIPEPEIEVD